MKTKPNKKLNWKQLLIDREAYCYIKPNRHIHESGYRCFEVGYCTVEKERIKDKLILSEWSDHFWHRREILTDKPPLEFNMDILKDGYIRVFNGAKVLTWENSYSFVVSSFSLEVMENYDNKKTNN